MKYKLSWKIDFKSDITEVGCSDRITYWLRWAGEEGHLLPIWLARGLWNSYTSFYIGFLRNLPLYLILFGLTCKLALAIFRCDFVYPCITDRMYQLHSSNLFPTLLLKAFRLEHAPKLEFCTSLCYTESQREIVPVSTEFCLLEF